MTHFRKFLPFIAAILLLAGVGVFFRWIVRHRHAHAFPSAIVIHESASTWGDMNTIRRWHLSRGWSDIGYHAVILNGKRTAHGRYDPTLDGKIEPGRPENIRGCHCSADNMNATALGVCLIGIPGRNGYPTKRQIDSLIDYLATRCRKSGRWSRREWRPYPGGLADRIGITDM